MKLLAFGYGYSARAVLRRLAPRLEVAWGTTRSRDKAAAMEADVRPLIFAPEAFDAAGTDLEEAIDQADHLLVSIAPGAQGDAVLARCRDRIAASALRSIVYLSTVGVYGDHDGAWVDEDSASRPVSRRSVERVEAETAWRAFAAQTGIPVAILRLSGIYGPGRGPFEKIRRGTARRVVKPGQVFNRIHVDDIAAAVAAAFDQAADGAFNITDDEPAPPQDVLAFAAELLGLPLPPEVAYADAEMTPMARSFYGENKRVRNERMKRELGVSLDFPTYREGLPAILAAEAGASEGNATGERLIAAGGGW